MGKVLKIATIVGAIAVNVIPGVGQAVSGVLGAAFSGTAIGGGVTAFGYMAAQASLTAFSTLGLAGAMGMASKALGLGPKSPGASAAAQSLAPRLMVGNGGVVRSPSLTRSAAAQSQDTGMLPMRARRHWRRWQLQRASGDCLEPHCRDGTIQLVDRQSMIRPDDIVVFKIARQHGGDVLCKRFRRAAGATIEFETTNPIVELYAIDKADIEWCYRVRRYLDVPEDWHRATREIAKDHKLHNERLGICVFPEGHRFG